MHVLHTSMHLIHTSVGPGVSGSESSSSVSPNGLNEPFLASVLGLEGERGGFTPVPELDEDGSRSVLVNVGACILKL